MSDYSMADIANLRRKVDSEASVPVAKNSTSRTGNTELNMEDFLTLMVVQLQNQTIDDTMDTSEMMNQMVQMQMISAITNMTETSIMSYASSLVGKVVTIGIPSGDSLEEREILVTGTGVSNGQQVIFGSDGETYALNQIMAVGRLPDIKEPDKPSEGEGEDGGETEGVEKPGEGGDVTKPGEGEDVEKPGEDEEGTNPPAVEGPGEGQETQPDPDTQYDGTQGAPTDD